MNYNAQALFQQALKLPPEARAALAGSLIASLDDMVDEDAEVAWQATIERRITEIDSSAVKMVPWSVARKRILGD